MLVLCAPGVSQREIIFYRTRIAAKTLRMGGLLHDA